MTTGEKIAALRRKAGLSQEALAEELGISRQAVSRWETNESLPDTEKTIRLSRRFGVTTDYLLLDSVQETTPSSAPGPKRRWFRFLSVGFALLGTLLTLTGLVSAILWAVQTNQWYTDFGRFGTALFFKWPGPILLGGSLFLLTSLLILAIDVLLKQQSNA